MKIVIAPDSFKGSLTALDAAEAMERGVRAACPDAETDILPMADGGEGTMDALVASTRGTFVDAETVDPLGRPLRGRYGVLGDGATAVIETANASGLLLLKERERNPLHTTTYGTGRLIRHALESGFRKMIVGIGGSATNDCGTGAVQALGVRFMKRGNKEISDPMCGRLLNEVESIDLSGLHPEIRDSRITVASDVKNPLLGENGCARVYSPQKGADAGMVELLEKNMASFIGVAEKTFRRSVRQVPGAGAAGGLGAGLMLFCDAKLRPGADLVMDACGFSKRIRGADLILTGEGKIDSQTAFGKTVSGIASRARKTGVPVVAFAGQIENADGLYRSGISSLFSICSKSMSLDQAMADAEILLWKTVESAMRTYNIQRKIHVRNSGNP
jgi:glycerate kinase